MGIILDKIWYISKHPAEKDSSSDVYLKTAESLTNR
jgi:hypothetical protein